VEQVISFKNPLVLAQETPLLCSEPILREKCTLPVVHGEVRRAGYHLSGTVSVVGSCKNVHRRSQPTLTAHMRCRKFLSKMLEKGQRQRFLLSRQRPSLYTGSSVGYRNKRQTALGLRAETASIFQGPHCAKALALTHSGLSNPQGLRERNMWRFLQTCFPGKTQQQLRGQPLSTQAFSSRRRDRGVSALHGLSEPALIALHWKYSSLALSNFGKDLVGRPCLTILSPCHLKISHRQINLQIIPIKAHP